MEKSSNNSFRNLYLVVLAVAIFGIIFLDFSLRDKQQDAIAKPSIEIIKDISKITILPNPENDDDGILIRIYPSSDGKKLVDIYVSKKEDVNNTLK